MADIPNDIRPQQPTGKRDIGHWHTSCLMGMLREEKA